MGALGGSVSYLRFLVDGEPPKGMAARFERNVEARRFMPLSPDGQDMEQAGWASVTDPFDDELALTREEFLFGDLIVIAYREDKVALPRPLLKAMAKKRIRELTDRGEEVTRQTRRTVELAVASELKRRVLPRSRVVDIVWDHPRGELRVFGRGTIATERATALFERTFEARPRLAHYGTRAFDLDLGLRAQGILEQLGPETVFQG